MTPNQIKQQLTALEAILFMDRSRLEEGLHALSAAQSQVDSAHRRRERINEQRQTIGNAQAAATSGAQGRLSVALMTTLSRQHHHAYELLHEATRSHDTSLAMRDQCAAGVSAQKAALNKLEEHCARHRRRWKQAQERLDNAALEDLWLSQWHIREEEPHADS